ncbi:MAG: hypothetical protein J6J38_04930 [Lachnospiraceae bacterium]|nr:hypothetical protein [Lachnospiraceae bacterium]
MGLFIQFLGQNLMELLFSIVGFLSGILGIVGLVRGLTGKTKKGFSRKKVIGLMASFLVAFACVLYVWEEYRNYSSEAAYEIVEAQEPGTDDGIGITTNGDSSMKIDGPVIQMSGATNVVMFSGSEQESKATEEQKAEVEQPKGYDIFVEKTRIARYEPFDISIIPRGNTAVTEIRIIAESPSGEVSDMEFSGGPYEIYSETGEWTIYAKLVNEAGVYVGKDSGEVVKVYVYENDLMAEFSYGVETLLNCFGR